MSLEARNLQIAGTFEHLTYDPLNSSKAKIVTQI